MALDMQAAINQYGVVAEIVSAVPELQGILQNAVKQQLSPDAFNAQIAASGWYRTHSDTARQLILDQASDPAKYQQQWDNQLRLVQQTAGQMGRAVDTASARSLALQSLAEGWSSTTLQQTLGQHYGLASVEGGAMAGQAAQISTHLEQTAQSYGVPYTQDYIRNWVLRIQGGGDTTDGFDQVMRNSAKAAYPQFAAQLDAGQTLQQIADPYMATYAKTLEVPQTSVTLSDPTIKRALQSVDPATGQPGAQPLWQFEQTLKKDPRYAYTDQAKTDAYSTLHEIGKSWGFSS